MSYDYSSRLPNVTNKTTDETASIEKKESVRAVSSKISDPKTSTISQQVLGNSQITHPKSLKTREIDHQPNDENHNFSPVEAKANAVSNPILVHSDYEPSHA